MGIMPLDQSYIFEGASKLYFGEKLYFDFYMPFGFVPVYIQLFIFKLFGINWWSYVLHAAIFNGLFVVLSHKILSLFIQNKLVLILTAIISAFLFYPLIGTPQAENHAIYFSFLSFYLLFKTIEDKPNYGYFVVPLMLLAFLSKQNPSSFFILAMIVFTFFHLKKLNKQIFINLSIGLGITVIIILLFLKSIYLVKFYFYVFELPKALVDKRLSLNPITINLIFKQLFLLGFHSMLILPILLASIFVLRKKEDAEPLKLNLIFGLFFLLIFFASLMTQNQPQLYMPVTIIIFSVLVFNLVKPLFVRKRNVILVIFSIILLADFSLNASFIFQRRYNDLVFTKNSFQNYNKKFGFYFQTSWNYNMQNADIMKLLDFIENNEGNFLYVGDLLIVNGLTRNVSPLPATFYHQGVAQPIRWTTEFHEFNLKLYKKMKEFDTKYIIVENSDSYCTWLQMSVYDFFQRDYIEDLEVIDLGYFHILMVEEIP
jgi:hypothetical protein